MFWDWKYRHELCTRGGLLGSSVRVLFMLLRELSINTKIRSDEVKFVAEIIIVMFEELRLW
jgi:hypothetical protein